MVYQAATSFLLGTGFALGIGSPVEWLIHKYLLHATPEQRKMLKFIRNASVAHNDKHHGAFKGPAHYYRDITNENEVIHFSKKDVGVIAGIAGIVGLATDRAYCFLAGNNSFDGNDAAFIAGTVAGTMLYYGAYEFTHHYMHDIGKRRLGINRTLGDIIQGNERDGKLRFSKPLLDTICNTVEFYVDEHRSQKRDGFYFEPYLVGQLEKETEINRKNDLSDKKAIITVERETSERILSQLTTMMIQKEREIISSMSKSEKASYLFQRSIQKCLRRSEIFRGLDDHHFLHHFRFYDGEDKKDVKKYGKNLNVVFPLMDIVMGTKKNSSRKVLEEDRYLWLCPNSPDIKPFSLPKPSASREEPVAAAA